MLLQKISVPDMPDLSFTLITLWPLMSYLIELFFPLSTQFCPPPTSKEQCRYHPCLLTHIGILPTYRFTLSFFKVLRILTKQLILWYTMAAHNINNDNNNNNDDTTNCHSNLLETLTSHLVYIICIFLNIKI